MSLLNLYGPSRREIWQKLSTEVGGKHIDGNFWKGDKVQATHGQWTITLDTFTQITSTGKTNMVIPFTRMRAPYVNKDGFRFTIYRRGFFSDVAKFFGMQDIQVGHEPIDRDFIIKGTDEAKLKALFSNARLRELLLSQPQVHLTVKDDEGYFGTAFPQGVDELLFIVAGQIKDLEQLKQLYELFAEMLDQLCQIGSAYEKDPQVKL